MQSGAGEAPGHLNDSGFLLPSHFSSFILPLKGRPKQTQLLLGISKLSRRGADKDGRGLSRACPAISEWGFILPWHQISHNLGANSPGCTWEFRAAGEDRSAPMLISARGWFS